MEPSCDFNRHLGWRRGPRSFTASGSNKVAGRDSRAAMEAAGSVGRYRGRGAFTNTGHGFTTEICSGITFTIDFLFLFYRQ